MPLSDYHSGENSEKVQMYTLVNGAVAGPPFQKLRACFVFALVIFLVIFLILCLCPMPLCRDMVVRLTPHVERSKSTRLVYTHDQLLTLSKMDVLLS